MQKCYCIIWFNLVRHKMLTLKNSCNKGLSSSPLLLLTSQFLHTWTKVWLRVSRSNTVLFCENTEKNSSTLDSCYSHSSIPITAALQAQEACVCRKLWNLLWNFSLIDRLEFFFSDTLMFACYFLCHVNDGQLSHPLWMDFVCACEIDL